MRMNRKSVSTPPEESPLLPKQDSQRLFDDIRRKFEIVDGKQNFRLTFRKREDFYGNASEKQVDMEESNHVSY